MSDSPPVSENGDEHAARALMVLSCISSFLASVFAVMGMKCTHFAQRSVVKSPLLLSGGIGFLCAGLLCLITVAWTTNDVILDFYNPFYASGMKYEIGLAVYLGYTSSFLSLIGGSVLCWSSGTGRERSQGPLRVHMSQPSSPPPPFNNTYLPAPLYRPHEALKDNRAPSLCSLSSSGYRLNNYV
ncbi:PREDICTED: claudin-14-like [Cyprinodon variegatus]|nr:PREDICTED: claudin-14-like [Cyprinodon variegatus]